MKRREFLQNGNLATFFKIFSSFIIKFAYICHGQAHGTAAAVVRLADTIKQVRVAAPNQI